MNIYEVETFEKYIGGHKYRYILNEYPINPKLEEMIKKHFTEALKFAKKYEYHKVKEIVKSQQHLFRLQLTDGKNLISYDILHDIKVGDKTNVAYTILFNERQFEYNNLKNAYTQLKSLIESNTSIETSQNSDGNIETPIDSTNISQVLKSQFNSLKEVASENNYTIKIYNKDGKDNLLFHNKTIDRTIVFGLFVGTGGTKFTIQDSSKTELKEFSKLFSAHKYLIELLTSKKLKSDKNPKEPLSKEVNSEIDSTPKFNKLFDTIVAYKDTNDKGYTRLINFLTGELYKNKDIKNLIDLNYNGDTSQIKNIINNHFTKK